MVYYNGTESNTMYQEDENKVVEEATVAEPTSPKEEAPKNEVKKNKNNPDEAVEFARSENLEATVEEIEKERKALLEVFNKTKFVSRIIMGIVVVAVLGAIIMIFNELMVLKIIGYSLAGAVLLLMVIYYIFTKDKFPRTSRAYIAKVTNLINAYDFDDSRFNELKVYPNKKLNKTDLEVDRAYTNSSDIGSRNVITGKFDGHHFEVSENVLYSMPNGRKGQRSVIFLGKYISLENSLKFEGRYIFNLKGNPEKLVDQPNDIDDLKVALEEDNLIVYAPNDKPLKDVFGTKFLSELKTIKTDEKLLNAVVVIWAGHTAAYLSYDDSVTVLPFEHPFNREAQDKYKGDLLAVLELVTKKK